MSASDTTAPEVLTANEAAELLRMTPAHVRRLAAAGELPGARRIGGTWRFSRSAIAGMFDGAPA
jgi:excisionase family DNA binding protein